MKTIIDRPESFKNLSEALGNVDIKDPTITMPNAEIKSKCTELGFPLRVSVHLSMYEFYSILQLNKISFHCRSYGSETIYKLQPRFY